MSLYQQQREQVRKNILETSVTIFREKGYENATIQEITKSVGIAKGTFYNFFSSKSEILITWAVDKFQTVDFQEVMNASKTIEENLIKFIGILVREIENEERLFQSFLKEIIKVHGDSTYSYEFDFLKIYYHILTNSSDKEKAEAALIDVKVHVLNSALFMGMINWFNAGNSIEGLHEYLLNVIRVCLYGLLSDRREG